MGVGREPGTSTGLFTPQRGDPDADADRGGSSLPALICYSLLAGIAIVGIFGLVGQLLRGLDGGVALALQAATAFLVTACAVWAAEPVVAWIFPRGSGDRSRR